MHPDLLSFGLRWDPVPGNVLGIVGQDPNNSKSSRLHFDIFRFCFHSFEVYSIDSSKMIDKSPEILNFNGYFLNSTGSSATNRRFFPNIEIHSKDLHILFRCFIKLAYIFGVWFLWFEVTHRRTRWWRPASRKLTNEFGTRRICC